MTAEGCLTCAACGLEKCRDDFFTDFGTDPKGKSYERGLCMACHALRTTPVPLLTGDGEPRQYVSIEDLLRDDDDLQPA